MTTVLPTTAIQSVVPPSYSAGQTAPGAEFSGLLTRLLADTNSQQMQADVSVKQLMTGQTDNVHDVVLSIAKADMSFRLMLEIRNRVTEAYQEIMRMQV